jgi:hypothetical protein
MATYQGTNGADLINPAVIPGIPFPLFDFDSIVDIDAAAGYEAIQLV